MSLKFTACCLAALFLFSSCGDSTENNGRPELRIDASDILNASKDELVVEIKNESPFSAIKAKLCGYYTAEIAKSSSIFDGLPNPFSSPSTPADANPEVKEYCVDLSRGYLNDKKETFVVKASDVKKFWELKNKDNKVFLFILINADNSGYYPCEEKTKIILNENNLEAQRDYITVTGRNESKNIYYCTHHSISISAAPVK